MGYEVTKTINGRQYKYRVERVRDEATGRSRSRWVYLGRADGGEPARAPRSRGSDARERLLDALERVLERVPYSDLTADAVAREAHLAHGTFYRHFRDKRAALRAAMERLRASRTPIVERLHDDVPDRAAARAGVRAFAEVIVRARDVHPSLLRAWYALALREPEFAEERRARRAAIGERLTTHLRALVARGLAHVDDPEQTATVVLALCDEYYRETVVDGVALDEARVAAILVAIDRIVFGSVA